MKRIVNKFLLGAEKFMHKLHLRLPGFIYSTCVPFTKHGDSIQKFKEAVDLIYTYIYIYIYIYKFHLIYKFDKLQIFLYFSCFQKLFKCELKFQITKKK